MKWMLKRFLCLFGAHFHSKRGRYLLGYGNGTFDNPSSADWNPPKKVDDNADKLSLSCGCLVIPRLADICPVCGHRRAV